MDIRVNKRGVSGDRFRAKGDQFRDKKDWLGAADAYREYLAVKPDDAAIWVQLGHALKESGQIIQAEHAYAKAISLNPEDADTFVQIGHAYKLQGQMEHAFSSYSRALAMEPSLTSARQEVEALNRMGFRAPQAAFVPPPTMSQLTELKRTFSDRADGQKVAHVTIVGKFGRGNGIALHTHAVARCLEGSGLLVQGLDTRPRESDAEHKKSLPIKFVEFETAAPSLVSIYCDVIANSPDDWNIQKIPDSFIKIAYAVFDSSQLPGYWAERLNTFDAIAVPDVWLVEVLKRSGVRRPIFTLPLALDYSGLEGSRKGSGGVEVDDAVVFGCIATYSERKNLKSLVNVFHSTFANDKDVRLHIHGALNFSNGYEHLLEHVKRIGATNIILTSGELTEGRYAKLLYSFSVYVNVSKGEGFSITPRQALYLGLPTILSDNTAHRTIVESGLVHGIPTARYERAHFEAMEGIECGYQCVPDQQALKTAMIKAYRQADGGSQDIPAKRRFADSYSIESLKWHYRAMLFPKDCFLTSSNKIERNYLETCDASLYEKFREIRRITKAALPETQSQRLVVVGNDGGFFSLFNTFVSHLVWNIGRAEVDAIIPDWRIESIMRHRDIAKFTSFCYGRREDGNLWLKFCYPVLDQDIAEESYNNLEIMDGDVVKLMDYNESSEPNLTYIHAYKLYKDKDFPAWRKWYHRFYAEHIRFRDHITSEVETFAANSFDADYIIGCHVRHPSHGIEQPGARMPTVDLFQRLVIERVSGLGSWKVFLATDQESVVSAFANVFGDRLIYRSGVARVSSDDDQRYNSLSLDEQQREGHQIQHLTAADEASWSTRMGDEVIIDALLLAKCDSFLHVTSNIATAVAFMNPNIEMIYCE